MSRQVASVRADSCRCRKIVVQGRGEWLAQRQLEHPHDYVQGGAKFVTCASQIFCWRVAWSVLDLAPLFAVSAGFRPVVLACMIPQRPPERPLRNAVGRFLEVRMASGPPRHLRNDTRLRLGRNFDAAERRRPAARHLHRCSAISGVVAWSKSGHVGHYRDHPFRRASQFRRIVIAP